MPIRFLCLGNELLADDAFGFAVAERIREGSPEQVEVLQTSETGFRLLDYIQGASRLLVIDTVLTGAAEPGTVHVLQEKELAAVSGCSPHYVGLFEMLAAARKLCLPVPEQVVILAVEAADCTTVGGAMHPAVRAAIAVVAILAKKMIGGEGAGTPSVTCSWSTSPARGG